MASHGGGLKGGGATLTGNNVLLGSKQVADSFLLDMREFLVEVIGESECYDRQTRVVGLACRAFFVLLLTLCILEIAFFAVNVTDAAVPALCVMISARGSFLLALPTCKCTMTLKDSYRVLQCPAQ